MPQISLPDIKLPDVRFRDGKLRDLKMPDIDLRHRLPDVDLSGVQLPHALRDLSMPDVKMPDFHMPDVHMPDMKRVDSALASVHLPDVRMPDFKMPDVDLAAIRRLGRPEPKRRSLLPWVVVASMSAAFAGWWLATSSVTGPKVRAVAQRVRTRIDELRNGGGAEWADGEEQAESFWSSESGWESRNNPSTDGDAALSRPHAMSEDEAAPATDSWAVSSAVSQTSSDPSVGGTGFDGDTAPTAGGETSEREG